jgi:hypothetical protein
MNIMLLIVYRYILIKFILWDHLEDSILIVLILILIL